MRLAPAGVLLLRPGNEGLLYPGTSTAPAAANWTSIFDIDRFARRGPVRLPGLGFLDAAPLLEIVDDLEDCIVAAAPISIVGERRVPVPVAPDQGTSSP